MQQKLEEAPGIPERGTRISGGETFCPTCRADLSGAAREGDGSTVGGQTRASFRNGGKSAKGLVAALKIIGWATLVAGMSTAAFVWLRFAVAEVRSFPFFSRGEKVINYFAVGVGVGFVIAGIAALLLFLAVARILEHVAANGVNTSVREGSGVV